MNNKPKNAKIFLIDQEKFRCQLWKLALSKVGHQLFTPEDINDPYYMIKDIKPDLILLDASTLTIIKEQFFYEYSQEQNIELKKSSFILLGFRDQRELFWQQLPLAIKDQFTCVAEFDYPLSPTLLADLLAKYLL